MVAGAVNHQENASHTCGVVEESFYDTTCVRERLSTRLPSRSPTGAPSSSGRPSATVGASGHCTFWCCRKRSRASPPIPEKEPSLIAGRLQIPRSPIESVNTSRQLQQSSIAPPPRLRRCVRKLRPQSLKHRSNSAVKHRDEMTKNRRGLD